MRQLGLLDFEELEACDALHQHRNMTISELLAGWQDSKYRKASFRSYIWPRYGGQDIGRPDDMRYALAETVAAIQKRLAPNDAAGDESQIHLRPAGNA